MADPLDRGPGPYGQMAEDASLGWGIAVAVGAGIMLGMWVDNRWGLDPWGLIGGFAFGMTAAGRLVWQAQKRSEK